MVKPVAYLILAHTDPANCVRLVNRLLEDPASYVFVHIDLKSREDFSRVFALDGQRVRSVKERFKVYWAGFNMVKATLASMREAAASECNFGYYALLSGLDYPLKHASEIRSYFYSQPFRQHINRLDVEKSPEHYLKNLVRYNFRDGWLPWVLPDKVIRKVASLALRPIRRVPPAGRQCTGSQWWALTDDCVRYILQFVDEHPEYERHYRYVWAPDEFFFQSIVENSPFRDEAPPLIPYQGRGMWRTANFHVVHPSLSKIYTHGDYEHLLQSDRCFVRKVTSAQSAELLNRLDERLMV